jgi:putative hydrolase of the HAD superfamily
LNPPLRYPFVLLDVGETLLGPRRSYGAVYAEVLAELGLELPAAALERGIRLAATEMAERIPPGVDRFSFFPGGETEYWLRFSARAIADAAGREPDRAFRERALERLSEAFQRPAAWEVYADVGPALRALRAQGCRLGIVSNWDSRLPRILERLGLAACFEAIGVSHLERVEKPDPSFFLSVLERLGGSPERALHVGNVPELDVAGARAAGIDGVLLDRAGPPGSGVLQDLRDLPAIARRGLDRRRCALSPRSRRHSGASRGAPRCSGRSRRSRR